MAMTRDEYLLLVLGEECGEIAQVASECGCTELAPSDRRELIAVTTRIAKISSKSLRFGIDDGHPSENQNNRERLGEEVCDFLGVVEMLREKGVLQLSDADIRAAVEKKRKKVERYMEYSTQRGQVDGPSSPQEA